MRHISIKMAVAILLLAVALPAALPVKAQPIRNGFDVIWARDVEGAEMTLDGQLNEPEWMQAETIELVWNKDQPGFGQFVEGTPTLLDPPDPNNGMVYVLRDGNTLWLGAMVQDKSIGGATGLWGMDGFIMNILDRARFVEARKDAEGAPVRNFFQGNRTEFFYSWWNSNDTTDATTTYDDGTLIGTNRPLPGVEPRFHGFYGHDRVAGRDSANIAVWDARTVVDGIANDDTHGEDVGYTMEMRIDMSVLGYDYTQPDGDKTAWNIALQDHDYAWPADPDNNFLSRVWWQNLWGNNFNDGIAYILGSPDVTVSSGAAPEVTEPEFTVPSGELFDAPTIDGNLDDPAWVRIEPIFHVGYQAEQSVLDMNPEVAKYYQFFFRPDVFGQGDALVVDPSIARIKMFHKDTILYVGLDVDDQAVSGSSAEGGMDGMYLFLRDQDSLTTRGAKWTRRFDFRVDSMGAIAYGADALTFNTEDPTAVVAAVGLKGASTAADPSDVDEGYQIEIAIDLTKALAYPEDLGDRKLWTALNFLEGDFLETEGDSYAMRTWIINERGGGGEGASIYGYLDPNSIIGTAVEDVTEIPESIKLYGSYPNPFNPSTRIAYAIPNSGEVTIEVFSVLGQKVAELAPGIQAAGRHEVTFDAKDLTSGLYFYRVALKSDANVTRSRTDRLVLVK
ncbi:MAG TPA: T9SS type A sorting domain-containing protein [Rhodothermales bacterium]|nr:T9SS type A sorting domain-containing protein [Rhodothermales bacterium]